MSDTGQLRITGGTVYDPANGIDGEVRDICIESGRIVQNLPVSAPTLRVSGMVVMPGAPAPITPAGFFQKNTHWIPSRLRPWTATGQGVQGAEARFPPPSPLVTATQGSGTPPSSMPRLLH